MSNDWFREYVYEVTVKKEFVPKQILDLLETEPVELNPWDSLI